MYALKVPLKDTQRVRKEVSGRGIYDYSRQFTKDTAHIYLPITEPVSIPGTEVVEKDLESRTQKVTFKDEVKNILTEQELEHLKTAFDTIGEIAILEIDDELISKEKEIAKVLMKTNPQIKTVLKKSGIHGGEFRTQHMKHLAGIDTKIATHKENNVFLKLDVENIYYSPRSATERKRVFEQVKPHEKVLVMFSGCAPFVCTVAKNSQADTVIGIEKNPIGHKYGAYNVEKNKLSNAKVIQGDVREEIPKLNEHFDRIIMPLPKDAHHFLDVALSVAKKGTLFHLYMFLKEEEFKPTQDLIVEECKKQGFKATILDHVKCGQQSPHTYRTTIDFVVEPI